VSFAVPRARYYQLLVVSCELSVVGSGFEDGNLPGSPGASFIQLLVVCVTQMSSYRFERYGP
jgi:hypothetical protein